MTALPHSFSTNKYPSLPKYWCHKRYRYFFINGHDEICECIKILTEFEQTKSQ